MTADAGRRTPLTKESVAERLAVLTADDVAQVEQPIEAADWAYIEAASVLSTFDPETLLPLRDVGPHSIGQLLACSVTVGDGDGRGALRWRLRDTVRREALARLGDREAILGAYEQNREQADDDLQRAFLAQLRGESKSLEQQGRAELAATLQVVQWLHGLVENVLDPALVRRELDRAFLFEPFRFLVGEHFQGRQRELRRLNQYVGVRPTASRSDAARRSVRKILKLRDRPPLLIHGVGGVGKSTLVAKFILDHAEYVRRDAIAFVYLDFDRATITAEEPSSVLIEATQQLACQVDKAPEQWEALRMRWVRRFTGESPRARRRGELAGSASTAVSAESPDEQQRKIEEFAKTYYGSFGDAPLLLVLDTFEEVQYRSRDFAAALWQFLEDLQGQIPTLRTVIAGRAPVESFPTDDVELQKLDEEAAAGMLHARGIEDEELARLIAARVDGNPLTLWLAAARVKQAFGDTPSLKSRAPEDALRLLEIERDITQETLYTRILQHIHDPDVRRLAHPGLVLRRITSELIRDVLAEPCGVDVPNTEIADQLFDAMAREVSLVRVGKGGALEHRRDLRRLMLPALGNSRPEAVAEIHRRAIEYYADRDDVVSRAEEIYHRLAADEDPEGVDNRWMDGVEEYLRDAIQELPPRAMAHLAGLVKVELDEATWAHASQVDRERRTEAKVEDLLTLGRPADALDVLATETERSPGSRLYLLEAVAQSRMGNYDESLQSIDAALRSMPSLEATPVLVELLSLAAELETDTGHDQDAAARLDAAHGMARSLEKPAQLLDLGLRRLQTTRRVRRTDQAVETIARELRDDVLEVSEDVLRANPELARDLSVELGATYPEVLERVTTALGLASFESGVRELRLALVCYGGLSLAVYTHGTTKEISRLVLGSALGDAGITPIPTEPAAQVYRDLLYELEQRMGVRTRVVVDIISGTSASGINGLGLAKALGHNLSQDSLRDFWLTGSEILRPKHGLRALLALWASAVSLSRRFVDPRGETLAKLLFSAFQAMDDRGAEHLAVASLMPEQHPLELSIPVTDIHGYGRLFQITEPRIVHKRQHLHTFAFRYENGERDDLGASGNGALAFAALTTLAAADENRSVSFEAFTAWVPEADLSRLQEQVARTYALGGDDAESARFMDGGWLQSKQLEWVADATKRQRPDVEAERRVLHIAPTEGDRGASSDVVTILGLARQESIANELTAVSVHNLRVRRIRDVVETSFGEVAELVESALGGTFPNDPSQLGDMSFAVDERTAANAGLGYTAYLRLRISGAIDGYARTFCNVCDFPNDSNHADLVRSVVRIWADQRGLFSQNPRPTESQRELLAELDLGYRERQLRFVEAGLRWWYRDLRSGRPDVPPRADLDQAKMLLYEAVKNVRRTMGGDGFDDVLRAQMKCCFPDAEVRDFLAEQGLDAVAYLERYSHELEAAEQQQRAFIHSRLDGFAEHLYGDLNVLCEAWHPERRREVFVRYLGFPLWDVLLLPMQAFDYIGENDLMQVQRMSPDDAHVLSTPPWEKLKAGGTDALSDRTGRETEYLWGRLDGAAQLIGIVLGRDHPDYRAWCLRAFAAILEEEREALPHISDTLEALRAELEWREPSGTPSGL
jgi:patatin-related protein